MKFDEYSRKINCKIVHQTEQSRIYETEKGTLIKKVNSQEDFNNEIKAYGHIKKNRLFGIPKIYSIWEDYFEMEFLKKEREPTTKEIVDSISPLYDENNLDRSFKEVNLSKEKLIERLEYLREEIRKRRVSQDVLKMAKKFVRDKYLETDSKSMVHGDLKPIHAIPTKKGMKFVDFALYDIANPWYDLAFLHMAEQEDKEKKFRELIDYSSNFSNLNDREKAELLQSNIFNRTLYNFGYALRHKPDKSLERTVKELNYIMDYKK